MFQAERQLSCNGPQNVEKLRFWRLVWIPAEILASSMNVISNLFVCTHVSSWNSRQQVTGCLMSCQVDFNSLAVCAAQSTRNRWSLKVQAETIGRWIDGVVNMSAWCRKCSTAIFKTDASVIHISAFTWTPLQDGQHSFIWKGLRNCVKQVSKLPTCF